MPDLKLKHVIIDTCFLIFAQRYVSENYFDDILNELKENECVPVVNELIKQEFVRLAVSHAHSQARVQFVEQFVALPIDSDIWNDAILISQVSRFCSKPGLSICDAVIMSQLKKWEKKIVLLTADLNDFQMPYIIRFNTKAIDVRKDVVTLAYHQFNNAQFQFYVNKFKAYRPKIKK